MFQVSRWWEGYWHLVGRAMSLSVLAGVKMAPPSISVDYPAEQCGRGQTILRKDHVFLGFSQILHSPNTSTSERDRVTSWEIYYWCFAWWNFPKLTIRKKVMSTALGTRGHGPFLLPLTLRWGLLETKAPWPPDVTIFHHDFSAEAQTFLRSWVLLAPQGAVGKSHSNRRRFLILPWFTSFRTLLTLVSLSLFQKDKVHLLFRHGRNAATDNLNVRCLPFAVDSVFLHNMYCLCPATRRFTINTAAGKGKGEPRQFIGAFAARGLRELGLSDPMTSLSMHWGEESHGRSFISYQSMFLEETHHLGSRSSGWGWNKTPIQ